MTNATLQRIWSEEYTIASYLVNLRGKAGLYAMLNLIQDVGWMHAFHLNVRLAPGQNWVFTRQKLVMKEWPAWNETVTIRTWLRPPVKSFLFRDYEVWRGDQKIGEGAASFLVMDLNTRRPVQLDWSHLGEIWQTEKTLALEPEKIMVEGPGQELARFQVRNSDLDMNNHVNNTKYVQWILDALPVSVLRKGINLHGYEVNFLAEAKLGDEIIIQRAGANSFESSPDADVFLGTNSADGKLIFTARLLSSTP